MFNVSFLKFLDNYDLLSIGFGNIAKTNGCKIKMSVLY